MLDRMAQLIEPFVITENLLVVDREYIIPVDLIVTSSRHGIRYIKKYLNTNTDTFHLVKYIQM